LDWHISRYPYKTQDGLMTSMVKPLQLTKWHFKAHSMAEDIGNVCKGLKTQAFIA